MKRALVLGLLVLGCSKKPEAQSPQRPPGEALPAAWKLPAGWRWLTSTRAGFKVAWPGLPVPEPGRLVVRTQSSEHAVAVGSPIADAVKIYREEIIGLGWAVRSERAVGPGVQQLEIGSEKAEGLTRVVTTPAHTYLVTYTSAPDGGTAGTTFVESFVEGGAPEPKTLHHDLGEFTITVPARVSDWKEASARPPLLGYAGLYDGMQFGVSYAELPLAPTSPSRAVLDQAIESSVAAAQGRLLAREDGERNGRPTVLVRVRLADGTHGVRRLTLARQRLYEASVYARGGVEPPWAAAFVDSLHVDP